MTALNARKINVRRASLWYGGDHEVDNAIPRAEQRAGEKGWLTMKTKPYTPIM
jgi:hypothetical protein